ncbi:MAG: hypothetical protein ACK4TK_00685 [Thiobacillaceae bacterium]
MLRLRRLLLLFLSTFHALQVSAEPAVDEDALLFKSAAEVNEGALRFLAEPPARPIHRHVNRITITDSSLEDGWVRLNQCHENLDPMPDVQVTYREGRVRNLRVTRAENIGQSWAETHTVQLRDVQRNAVLCIEAETRALWPAGDNRYVLANGPYMRRFLDGFYPMRVSMQVHLDTPKLRFVEVQPEAQPGFQFWQRDHEVGYDAVFEGILNTLMRFDRIQP